MTSVVFVNPFWHSFRGMIRVLAAIVAGCLTLLALACGGFTQTEWVLTDEPSGNTVHLEVAIGNSCKSLDRINVYESPTVVNLEAYVRGGDDNCEDILKIERRDVQLAQPLGDRRLEGCDPPGPNLLRGPALQDCRSKNADVGR